MQRFNPSTIWRLFGLLVTILGFSGCADQKPTSSPDTVRCWIAFDPLSIDPRIDGTARSQPIFARMFEGLMRKDTDGIPQPELAQSIMISEDKKTYTFSLRPSQWSDGSPVTAHDFEYAWKSIISHDVQTKHAAAFFCIKNAKKTFENSCSIEQVGIHALNDATLQVELEYPAPYFLEWVANPLYSPICRSSVAKKATMDALKGSNYICNGPYRLTSRVINQNIDLEKNPYYRGPKTAQHERIQFIFVPDPNTAYNLFCKGELDWIGPPFSFLLPETTESLLQQNRLLVCSEGYLSWMICNVHLKHLASVKIRQALACAINRKEISEKLLQNLAYPAYSILSSQDSLLRRATFSDGNTEMARRLFLEGLSETGYTLETFPHLTLSCYHEQRQIIVCELIAQHLRSTLGLTVDVQTLEKARLLNDVINNRIELCCFEWISYLNDPIYTLANCAACEGGFMKNNWKNQAYADLIQASHVEGDPQKRTELLRSAERLIMEELPCIPLMERPYVYAKQNNVHEDFFMGIGFRDPEKYKEMVS